MSRQLAGGCACGAVRYRLVDGAYDIGWCHCRLCQKSSGAPALVFATSRIEAFVIDEGADAIGSVRLSPFGERRFCTRCGSLLTIHVDFQPDEIDITAATLDDPEAVQPGFHIFYADRIGWALAGDDLPRHDHFRPNTRGLAPGAQCK